MAVVLDRRASGDLRWTAVEQVAPTPDWDDPVTILLNGERRELPGPLTVAELLRRIELRPEQVAVEVNRDLVPRARHDQTDASGGRRARGRDPRRRRVRRRSPDFGPEPLADRLAHGPEPAVRRDGQVRDARTDARLPRRQRGRGGDGGRASRAAVRQARPEPARLPGPGPLHDPAQYRRLLLGRGRPAARPARSRAARQHGQPRRRLGQARSPGRPEDAAARPPGDPGGDEGPRR